MCVLLVIATIVPKLLGLISADWANYAWGVSQNLTAAGLLIVVEGYDAARLAKARRLVAGLRQTVEDVIAYDLAKIDQEAFRVSRGKKGELEKVVTRMLADTVRARSRLDRALGQIDGATPETRDEIDTETGAHR